MSYGIEHISTIIGRVLLDLAYTQAAAAIDAGTDPAGDAPEVEKVTISEVDQEQEKS